MRRREFVALVLGSVAGAMAASVRAGGQQVSQTRTPPPPQPVPQVTPQLNAPGPQAVPAQPGNPVQQLAPLGGPSSAVRTGRIRNPRTVRSRRRTKRRQAE
jgi:hypothetical protein